MIIDKEALATSVPVDVRDHSGLALFKAPENIGSVALISHPHDARRAQIWGLRVDAEHRGRKVASSLMKAVRHTVENSGIQELHTYAANERTAHLMGREFGDRPMQFGQRDHIADSLEPFPARGLTEVISWIRACRQDEYPSDPAGTDELIRHSALIIVDMRPTPLQLQSIGLGLPAAAVELAA